MKKLVFLILLIAAAKFAWGYPLEKPTSSYSERAWLEGIGNYEKAKQLAAEHNAPLMVYVYTDWCGYCRKFQNELLYSPQYRDNFKPVVKLRINPERDAGSDWFMQQYRVSGYPTVLVKHIDEADFSSLPPFNARSLKTGEAFFQEFDALDASERTVGTLVQGWLKVLQLKMLN